MTELLEKAVRAAQGLPADQQDAVAGAIFDYLDHEKNMKLTDEQAEEVRRRIADPDQVILSFDEARQQIERFWQSK